MSLRSMTGFARVRKELPQGELVLSLKSVNHRALDLHFHMASDFDPYEAALRAVLKRHINRGHVQLQVQINNDSSSTLGFNRELLRDWIDAFRVANAEFGLDSSPDLNAAFRLPGMMQGPAPAMVTPGANLEAPLIEATTEAVHLLNSFRDQEGAAIALELIQRRAHIVELAQEMEKIRKKATSIFQKRLNERLTELLHGASIDPQRLAHEAAILVERSDISEELVRLKTHAGQLGSLLEGSGEKGKKMDFLLQEMNREANTILSKTGGLGDLGLTITDLALAAKAEIDKIREQSLNIE
jgi:uncharacterized protein (TIGR00255 family)